MSYYLKYETADGGAVLVEIEGETEIPQEGVVNTAGPVGDIVKDTVQ